MYCCFVPFVAPDLAAMRMSPLRHGRRNRTVERSIADASGVPHRLRDETALPPTTTRRACAHLLQRHDQCCEKAWEWQRALGLLADI